MSEAVSRSRKAPTGASDGAEFVPGRTASVAVPRETLTTPPFTVQELRNCIPAHCFERSNVTSFTYLAKDVAIVTVITLIGAWLHFKANMPTWLALLVWPAYAFVQVRSSDLLCLALQAAICNFPSSEHAPSSARSFLPSRFPPTMHHVPEWLRPNVSQLFSRESCSTPACGGRMCICRDGEFVRLSWYPCFAYSNQTLTRELVDWLMWMCFSSLGYRLDGYLGDCARMRASRLLATSLGK